MHIEIITLAQKLYRCDDILDAKSSISSQQGFSYSSGRLCPNDRDLWSSYSELPLEERELSILPAELLSLRVTAALESAIFLVTAETR